MNLLFATIIFLSLYFGTTSTTQGVTNNTPDQQNFLNYAEMSAKLVEIAKTHPTRTFLYSIGKSGENRDLWVMAIAKEQPNTHVLLRPEIKFVGNVYGGEVLTREILLKFIQLLVNNPENDTRVDEILSGMRVHVLVSMNPDGAEHALDRRHRDDDHDDSSSSLLIGKLMRNKRSSYRSVGDFARSICNDGPRQGETQAVREWTNSNGFLLSSELHTTYPFVTNCEHQSGTYTGGSSVHDDVTRYLAKQHGTSQTSHRTKEICDENSKPQVKSVRMDNNLGTKELHIDIGCCSATTCDTDSQNLNHVWPASKNRLIEISRAANVGIRGVVKYHNGQPARHISVQFNAIEPITKTNEQGEYFTMLAPGTYNITLMFNCDPIHYSFFRLFDSSKSAELNVILKESLFARANKYTLDSSLLCCNQSNAAAAVNCSIGKSTTKNGDDEDNDATTTDAPSDSSTTPSSDGDDTTTTTTVVSDEEKAEAEPSTDENSASTPEINKNSESETVETSSSESSTPGTDLDETTDEAINAEIETLSDDTKTVEDWTTTKISVASQKPSVVTKANLKAVQSSKTKNEKSKSEARKGNNNNNSTSSTSTGTVIESNKCYCLLFLAFYSMLNIFHL